MATKNGYETIKDYCLFCVRLRLLYCKLLFSDTGLVNFDSFCRVAGHFLENEDDEALQKELKEAFRLYDKEGMYLVLNYTFHIMFSMSFNSADARKSGALFYLYFF